MFLSTSRDSYFVTAPLPIDVGLLLLAATCTAVVEHLEPGVAPRLRERPAVWRCVDCHERAVVAIRLARGAIRLGSAKVLAHRIARPVDSTGNGAHHVVKRIAHRRAEFI